MPSDGKIRIDNPFAKHANGNVSVGMRVARSALVPVARLSALTTLNASIGAEAVR